MFPYSPTHILRGIGEIVGYNYRAPKPDARHDSGH
jgi:hypothetical protein